MKAKELRKKYIAFFKQYGHKDINSAPLIPENDPTVLFTTAGMHPLVPFLMGEKHPQGKRLVGVQKCVRTGDIDKVGDASHLTFFEMLGNWSLGDYFKEEAIKFSFEFLTSSKWLNIPIKKLAITVFKGDKNAPLDEEAYNIWRSLGIPEKRIKGLGKEHNWWGPAGETGPCGPDTEMFYWSGDDNSIPEDFNPDDPKWIEIWNDVFMEYYLDKDGKLHPLSQKNVDTGMGLERTVAALQEKKTVYETELFLPLLKKLDQLRGISKENIEEYNRSEKIIVEHIRAATFMLADGIVPGNVDQSYILRRIIRRAIRESRKLRLTNNFTTELAKVVIDIYKDPYIELKENSDKILEELEREEIQFAKTIEKGTKEFEKLISKIPKHIEKKVISGKNAFFLYETYGFPIELTEEIAKEHGFSVDKIGFEKAYKKHQELSRKGAEQKFKGGLADYSEKTKALHTATHLLHEALRRVLGPHVEQRGSNITPERLRFDFSHHAKLTKEEIEKVEQIVNEQIERALPVTVEEMVVEEALKSGAIGIFINRYGDRVKVYSIGDFSKEICGGPHVKNTKELGKFKIKKEESSSRGIRRIKAILIDKN